MKKMVSILMIMALIISIPVYGDDQTIVDIASGDSSFSILVSALEKADLVDALQGEGPFTVFAPTDDAFVALLDTLDIDAETLLNHPQLGEVLLYHVISGRVLSTDLVNDMEAATLQGESVKVNLESGVAINDSSVVTADIEASNGVIHVIDKVLVPSSFMLDVEADKPTTVVDIALSSVDFSMLVSLLQQASLVEALQGDGPFTVFAPTNAAFESLLEDLDISASDLMNQPDLSKVLLYHVVSGKVLSSDLSDGLIAETLNGEGLTFDLSNGAKVNASNINLVDIEAENGVVHVIDAVLVPENFNYQEVVVDEEIPKTGVTDLTGLLVIGIIGLGAVAVTYKKY